MSEPEPDEEVVEHCRKELQAIIDNTDLNATLEEQFAQIGHKQERVLVVADDLRQLGKFDLVLPERPNLPEFIRSAMARHWVYRHKDERVFVLSLSNKLALRAVGHARVFGFLKDTRKEN